ncbi:hypothetical protein K438DRAFT_750404 [Mycena galopus ATCC 62051]|nr:hypothetical protein K438DRAFT_750404 [Mycena galopus ATCC 62051]
MPRPTSSHSSSWSLESSPFVRRSPGTRQHSKLFIPGPPLWQSPEAFTRTSYERRIRFKRFTPPKRRHSLCSLSAELGFLPLLHVESIAPLSTPADLLPHYGLSLFYQAPPSHRSSLSSLQHPLCWLCPSPLCYWLTPRPLFLHPLNTAPTQLPSALMPRHLHLLRNFRCLTTIYSRPGSTLLHVQIQILGQIPSLGMQICSRT